MIEDFNISDRYRPANINRCYTYPYVYEGGVILIHVPIDGSFPFIEYRNFLDFSGEEYSKLHPIARHFLWNVNWEIKPKEYDLELNKFFDKE